MIWIVTGATGLIGRAMVSTLLFKGEKVIALSRKAEVFFKCMNYPNLYKYNYDLTKDEPSFINKFRGDIGLIMFASKISMSQNLCDLRDIITLDIYAHLRLLEKIKNRLRFGIYSSSCTVYGTPESFPVKENTHLAPNNVYSLTKVAGEKILSELFQTFSIPLAIFRITQVYGPGAPLGGAIYNFLRLVVEGKKPKIFCNPNTFRDYCYVDDVVNGIYNSIIKKVTGTYNLGSGSRTKIIDLARHCLKAVGRNDEPEIDPIEVPENMFLDISMAQSDFNYSPCIGIKEGIQRELRRLYPLDYS